VAWLLTGGAGYIGAHIARTFLDAGKEVVVLDNLATGYREFVPERASFVEGSVTDSASVDRTFREHEITGVVHLAGLKYAGVSVERPLLYFSENLAGISVLLEAVVAAGTPNFLFSSSSSWYGTIDSDHVTEDAPPNPESPYGQTKVASEWLLRDVAATTDGLSQTSLRYFNVVGSGTPELADHSPHNLFPKVFRAITAGEKPQVFGDDYPTPDGTCVRDQVHVQDLAEAHLAAAVALEQNKKLAPAYNVGTGSGMSVLEILDSMRAATGVDFEHELGPRRPGDPARVVGAVELIAKDLGWTAKRGREEMASSAWAAWQRQLELYGGPPPTGARLSL
jgi:UDP-glucose 4-epimerase